MATGLCVFLNYRPIFDKKFYCIVSVFLILLWNLLIHYEGHNKKRNQLHNSYVSTNCRWGISFAKCFPSIKIMSVYIYICFLAGNNL